MKIMSRNILGEFTRTIYRKSTKQKFQNQTPRSFKGNSISVSDVLVLNKEGVITSYYVEKEGFIVIAALSETVLQVL